MVCRMLWNPKTTEMTTQRGPAIGSENGLTDNLTAGVSRENGNCEVIRILFKRDSFSQRKQVKLLNSLFSQFTKFHSSQEGWGAFPVLFLKVLTIA